MSPDYHHTDVYTKIACDDMMIPTMTPNNPNALPKISITRILTNRVEFWASESAQLLPITPTQSLHNTAHNQKSSSHS